MPTPRPRRYRSVWLCLLSDAQQRRKQHDHRRPKQHLHHRLDELNLLRVLFPSFPLGPRFRPRRYTHRRDALNGSVQIHRCSRGHDARHWRLSVNGSGMVSKGVGRRSIRTTHPAGRGAASIPRRGVMMCCRGVDGVPTVVQEWRGVSGRHAR